MVSNPGERAAHGAPVISRAEVLSAIRGADQELFLPLEQMSKLVVSAQQAYRHATPFPHIVFDDFFETAILDAVLEEFPAPGQIKWQQFNNDRHIKLASSLEASFGPVTRLLLYHLNSITFLKFLSHITGIADLIGDPCFEGGGLHQIVRGGKLGIHADFNKHPQFGLDRRLNVLVYLNKNWEEEFGGHLELWDRSMEHCGARIAPVFNRMVIFTTHDFTYHGHPDPLRCPEGTTRKSLALYYFTNGRPAEEVSASSPSHSTSFRARSEDDFRLTLRQRVGRLAQEILPPIVSRRLRRLQ